MIIINGYLGRTVRRKHWTLSGRVREGFMEEVTLNRGSWRMTNEGIPACARWKRAGLFLFLSEEESS